jgi:hypothetical protein
MYVRRSEHVVEPHLSDKMDGAVESYWEPVPNSRQPCIEKILYTASMFVRTKFSKIVTQGRYRDWLVLSTGSTVAGVDNNISFGVIALCHRDLTNLVG